MVGTQGFEPWTSTASGWRSPPELRAYTSEFLREIGFLTINCSYVKANIAFNLFLPDLHPGITQPKPFEHIIQTGNDGKKSRRPVQKHHPPIVKDIRVDAKYKDRD